MSETRVRVKICGITGVDDARAAVAAGADMLGFIAVPESPRFVTCAQVAAIRAALVGEAVTTVVVAKTVVDAAAYSADAVQFYDGPPDPNRVSIRAFRVRDALSVEEALAYDGDVDALLLDAWHEKALGGAGVSFDASLARDVVARSSRRVILAGGLRPESVAAAISQVGPWGVDVSTGVEKSPGVKDHDRVRAFVAAARNAL